MKKRRRFNPEFKAQIVLEILTGALSPAEACRKHALSPNLFTTWKTTLVQRAPLSSSPTSSETKTRLAPPSSSNSSAEPPVRSRS